MIHEQYSQAFIGGLGTSELLVIFLIVLVLFGASRLPQVGSALGKAIKNFKQGSDDAGEPKPTDTENDSTKPEKNEK